MTTENYDLKAQIKAEHHRAELQRLDSGMAGCGCSDCQQLYRTLDLTKYGSRVVNSVGVILINEKQQAPDYWSADGSIFIHYGKKWGVNKKGARVCLDNVRDTPQSDCLVVQDKQDSVSKLLDGEILPPITKDSQKEVVMKHPGGRPRKPGEVSRVTQWRRNKHSQGVLL